MPDLRITVDGEELGASWTDENSETREAIADEFPLEGEAARWGEELYFDVPVEVAAEETQTEVPVGAVAYWPAGPALCLFWGPTPASQDETPRAASPVAVVAELDDVGPLSEIDGGAHVRVEDA